MECSCECEGYRDPRCKDRGMCGKDTAEEDRAEAWEYWHQRAIKFEAENARLRAVIKQAVEAYDSGHIQINSPEIGEPEVGIPMHPCHEEWLHYARAALSSTV